MNFSRVLLMGFVLLAAGCGGFERGEPDDTDNDTDDGATGDSTPSTGTLTFTADIDPILTTHCSSCHGSGGVAAASAFRLSGVAADDYAGVFALISAGNPGSSSLLQRASGMSHGGGVILAATAADYITIATWITDGAPQ